MAYAAISKPSLHFNTKLYIGNTSARTISGVGFQPDWTWIKNRTQTENHNIFDAVRTATKRISSNRTNVEDTQAQQLTAFASDGFSLGTDSGVNGLGDDMVAWNWKANGTGSANTAGSVNSTVSVNSTAGFSIVKYVGDGATTTTVGHGLGVVPQVILIKNLETTTNWTMYHHSMGNTGQLYLDTTTSFTTDADTFKNTTPTNTLWTMSNSAKTNQGSRNHIAYCFAEKTGYSKFGSYVGNGNANGTFVYTGFKPAFILQKLTTSSSTGWGIIDNTRAPNNEMRNMLLANSNAVQDTSGAPAVDFLSNGFKWRTTDSWFNDSNKNIYMAFAAEPLVANVGTGVPATAR